MYSPPGTLASMTGLSKGAHFGFGKGVGALVGGVLTGMTGSTALAFRIFGVVAFVFGTLYAGYQLCYGRRAGKKTDQSEEEVVKMNTMYNENLKETDIMN